MGVNDEYEDQFSREHVQRICEERNADVRQLHDLIAELERERDEAIERRPGVIDLDNMRHERDEARAEVERLRAEIRAAPHETSCSAGFSTIDGGPFDATHCDCWKRAALDGEGGG